MLSYHRISTRKRRRGDRKCRIVNGRDRRSFAWLPRQKDTLLLNPNGFTACQLLYVTHIAVLSIGFSDDTHQPGWFRSHHGLAAMAWASPRRSFSGHGPFGR